MVPNNPSALGIATLDGKDEWWPGQREVVEAIVAAFESGKRFVLADTGGGERFEEREETSLFPLFRFLSYFPCCLYRHYPPIRCQQVCLTGKPRNTLPIHGNNVDIRQGVCRI